MRNTGHTWIAAVLVLAVALGAGPALAEKGGHGKGHGNPHGGEAGVQDEGGGPPGKGRTGGKDASSVVVTSGERTVIQNYFIANPVGVSSLPPGIAKNLARGKPLPPGIAKQQAPYALVQQVPACRSGWECIVVGADLLILDAVHSVVRDIVRGVVR
ncbi:MAG TPA: anti-virulence regulator CigR family protein [Azospirillum sp.]|nr:anti-virulence regulator CigR family protein [Azospirillum sp.]